MKYTTERFKIGLTELIYLAIGIMLLLILGAVANGQTAPQTVKAERAHTQTQPLYREYRGVRLGMTAAEARAKLGEPAMKSDDQDYYVFSANETAQIVYIGQKVFTISTDYTSGIGAPDYTTVVGNGLLQRPDGSLFRMVLFDAEGLWVSYNKSAGMVPVVTITISGIR